MFHLKPFLVVLEGFHTSLIEFTRNGTGVCYDQDPPWRGGPGTWFSHVFLGGGGCLWFGPNEANYTLHHVTNQHSGVVVKSDCSELPYTNKRT